MQRFTTGLGLQILILISVAYPLSVFGADDQQLSFSTESTTVTDAIIQEEEKLKEVAISAEDQKTASTITTEVVPLPEEEDNTALYRLNGANGAACILISVDGITEIKYTTITGIEMKKSRFIPNTVTTSGDCSEQDDARFFMKWKTFTLSWSFAKTPGGERWYVDKIELSFNTSDPLFEHFKKPDRFLRLSTPHSHTMLFPTPVGKAYTCPGETTVVLRGSNVTCNLLLRKFKIQPFIFKKDEFGPEYECSPGGIGAFRDETAPIAVGSTFAIVVLVTVTGYGVFRYIKIKKVQYDTME